MTIIIKDISFCVSDICDLKNMCLRHIRNNKFIQAQEYSYFYNCENFIKKDRKK